MNNSVSIFLRTALVCCLLSFVTIVSYAQRAVSADEIRRYREQEGVSLAQETVTAFYDALTVIARDPESNSSMDASDRCYDLIQSDVTSNFPNEFGASGYDNLVGRLFVSSFRRFVSNNPSRFTYSIVSSVPFYEADWNKSLSDPVFVYFVVDKDYSGKSFRDTVLVDSHQKIIGIRNSAGGNAYSSSHPVANNIQELALRASRYYTNNQFSEAYSCYLDILALDKENMNANYQLAVMTYKRQGCHMSKKKAERLTKDYLRKAKTSAERAHDREKVDKLNIILSFLE